MSSLRLLRTRCRDRLYDIMSQEPPFMPRPRRYRDRAAIFRLLFGSPVTHIPFRRFPGRASGEQCTCMSRKHDPRAGRESVSAEENEKESEVRRWIAIQTTRFSSIWCLYPHLTFYPFKMRVIIIFRISYSLRCIFRLEF